MIVSFMLFAEFHLPAQFQRSFRGIPEILPVSPDSEGRKFGEVFRSVAHGGNIDESAIREHSVVL